MAHNFRGLDPRVRLLLMVALLAALATGVVVWLANPGP